MEIDLNPLSIVGLIVHLEILPFVGLLLIVLPFAGLWYGLKNQHKLITIISGIAITLLLIAAVIFIYFVYLLSQTNWSL